MIVYWAIIVISFLAFFLHIFITKTKSRAKMIELLLLYQLVFNMGVLSLFAFIGLTVFGPESAQYNNWAYSPFQQELANVNLGYSLVGFLCIWFRGHFWTAVILGSAVWLIADGIHHLVDAYYYGNTSEGNTGILPFTDIVVPLFFIFLLSLYLKDYKKKKKRVPVK